MNVPPLGHTEAYTIRAYEINGNKQMRIPALLRMLHESAMQNVLQIQLSFWDLMPHHISWVLMRQVLHIERLPTLGETVTIVTYPSGFERIFTYRDYKVYDKDGTLLVHSSSTWLLMDVRTRRMAKLPDFILDFKTKVENFEGHLPRCTSKFDIPIQSDREAAFKVQWYDLDFNEHTNNVQYITWLLQTLAPEVLRNQQLQRLEILFKAECLLGDSVQSIVQQQENSTFLHHLQLAESGKTLALAKSVWRGVEED